MEQSKVPSLNLKCGCCGGSGHVRRELQVGDIVEPVDGSSMPRGLHEVLAVWAPDKSHVTGFRHVIVKSIEGQMLGVEPVDWFGMRFDMGVKLSISGLWKNYHEYQGEGFWIHCCHVGAVEQ